MPEQTQTRKPAPPRRQRGGRNDRQVVVRYGRMGHVGLFRHHLNAPPDVGTMLVIRSERGTELGRVLVNVGDADDPGTIARDDLDQYVRANGSDYPFRQGGRVLRVANPQDLNDQQHLDRSAIDEGAFCRDQIADLALEMKLVAVEHLLGGERIVFFFTAEHRVDFRQLVKRMAGQYHTRIEMRQVGARDEARLVADYERCGQHCCCRQFLKFLKPVSMRMAKMQKATLDPTKISGRCGRLMCCLRYEDATYGQLARALPRKGRWVRTADGVVGRVTDTQVLTQLVSLIGPDGKRVAVANEDIVERDLPEPPAPSAAAPAAAAPARGEARPPTPEAPARPARPRAGPAPALAPKDAEAPQRPRPTAKGLADLDQIDEQLAQAAASAAPPPADPAKPQGQAAQRGGTAGGEKARAQPGGKGRRKKRRRRPRKKHPQAPSVSPSLGGDKPAPAGSGRGGDRKPDPAAGQSGGKKPSKRRRRGKKKRPRGNRGGGDGNAAGNAAGTS